MPTALVSYALPPGFWLASNVADLIEATRVCERRINKNSNVRIEQKRLNQLSGLIEDIASQSALTRELRAKTFPEEYLFLLDKLVSRSSKSENIARLARDGRIGSAFFPPDTVSRYGEHFLKVAQLVGLDGESAVGDRLRYCDEIAALGYGIVEIEGPISSRWIGQSVPSHNVHRVLPEQTIPKPSSRDKRGRSPGNLEDQVVAALSDGGPVNFGIPTHAEIVRVLHRFIYKKADRPATEIRVIYSDGSEAQQLFPIYSVESPKKESVRRLEALPPFRVALQSMRHAQMDVQVDISWFLNSQLSKIGQSSSGTDEICYSITLDTLIRIRKPVRIEVFQTGLQPSTVGFYRGLTEWLAQTSPDSRDILVVPKFYNKRSETYESAPYWG